jgi:hypothetical protein
MKTLRLLALVILFLPGFTGTIVARGVAMWSYQELIDKSDLVVLATPTATGYTKETIGIIGQQAIGVETKFTIIAVFKGDKTLKNFTLHHYCTPDSITHVANGPDFIAFEPVTNPTLPQRTFILFLIKEADGRYAPVVGQTDPGGAVKELSGVGK